MSQHLRLHLQVWWSKPDGSTSKRLSMLVFPKQNKKTNPRYIYILKPTINKKPLSQSLEVQGCLHPVINYMWQHWKRLTPHNQKTWLARLHGNFCRVLPGVEQTSSQLCSDQATSNDQMITSYFSLPAVLKLHNYQESGNILKEHIKLVLHFYVSQFLFICYKVHATLDYSIGTKKHVIFMGQAELQQVCSW